VAGAGDIYVDPLFVDAAAKNFKLSSSTEGQSITSPCIDAGDPADDYSREPSPNGSRINLGAYGGTALAERSWSATTTTSTSTTTTGTETTTTSTSTITTTTTPINKPVITTDPDSATINLAFNAPTEGAGILKIVEFGPPEREVLTKVVSAVSTGENLVTINQLSNTGEQLKQGPYKWYFEYNGQVSSGKIYIYRLR
jgi:hypothetical protein